jgi:hypothetical protein
MSQDQRAAFVDRQIYLNWKPARGGQMAIALVDALVRSNVSNTVTQRIAQNVRTMR